MTVKLSAITATLLILSCAPMVKPPLTDPPAFPLDLSYSRGDKRVSLEIDEHRIVTLRVTGQERVYGKVLPEDFIVLREIIMSSPFRTALRGLRGQPAGCAVWLGCDEVTFYGGGELLAIGSAAPRYASSSMLLDDVTTSPEAIVALLAFVDSSCTKVFGDLYVPIVERGD